MKLIVTNRQRKFKNIAVRMVKHAYYFTLLNLFNINTIVLFFSVPMIIFGMVASTTPEFKALAFFVTVISAFILTCHVAFYKKNAHTWKFNKNYDQTYLFNTDMYALANPIVVSAIEKCENIIYDGQLIPETYHRKLCDDLFFMLINAIQLDGYSPQIKKLESANGDILQFKGISYVLTENQSAAITNAMENYKSTQILNMYN